MSLPTLSSEHLVKIPSSRISPLITLVLDACSTGIYVNHTEFEGRARWGKTMPANDVDQDGNGHGTHCAGEQCLTPSFHYAQN